MINYIDKKEKESLKESEKTIIGKICDINDLHTKQTT